MKKQPNSQMCFVCGMENPIGLKLAFYEDEGGRVIAHFTPREEYQGYPGVLHGGIIAALLDEAAGRVASRLDLWTTTAKLRSGTASRYPLASRSLSSVRWSACAAGRWRHMARFAWRMEPWPSKPAAFISSFPMSRWRR